MHFDTCAGTYAHADKHDCSLPSCEQDEHAEQRLYNNFPLQIELVHGKQAGKLVFDCTPEYRLDHNDVDVDDDGDGDVRT